MEILSDSAAKIFGRDFLSLETAKNVLAGHQIEPVRPTVFTPEELLLDQARARGEFLIYRVNQSFDGKPLTIFQMVQMLQDKFEEQNWGKLLYAKVGNRWYQEEAFFMEDTPRPGLALVSKAPVPGSLNRNYHQQTKCLSELVGEIYEGREVPVPYQEALKEWETERGRLERILTSDRRGAGKGLIDLQINQLFREKPVEVFQSIVVPFIASQGKDRRLENLYTWTNAVTSDGGLVGLGDFDRRGIYVADWDPNDGYPYLGVCSSHSYL